MKQPKLPSLSKARRALYADWALRVKQADGWKCLLCGATENLTAHHWYVCDHHAHAARYCVDNGATLCYACHIRGVHQRADYKSVSEVFNKVLERNTGGARTDALFWTASVDALAKVELTNPILRSLWDEMRARPVEMNHTTVVCRGGKVFLVPDDKRPIAVPGNVADYCGIRYDVLAVGKQTDGRYRYTLKRLENAE